MLDRFERFTYAISEIDKTWHKIAAEEMERCGLKAAHGVYLMALYQNAEGLTALQLCEKCGKDKADASRMLKIMEEKGLVCKEGSNSGKYGGKYLLTDQGKEIASQAQKRVASAVDYAGSDLSELERDNFYDALEKVMTRLKELSEKGISNSSGNIYGKD